MIDQPFVDYYEVLQVSQNADTETVDRIYRLLAKRYHPDNTASGDEARFREVHTAYEILSDPRKRAEYDVQYDRNESLQWEIFEQKGAGNGHQEDQRIFRGVLSLLYAARRRNPVSGGLGSVDLERMLGVPREHLEFPSWYLKKKGWVEVLDSGQFAITIDGIDRICAEDMSESGLHLLTESPESVEPEEVSEPAATWTTPWASYG